MEPNQVVKQAPVRSAPVMPKDSILQDSGTKKGGKGAIIGMVIFAILALGGIGFGVWVWMDGNTQKDALNSQISALEQQNNDLQNAIKNGEEILNDGIDKDLLQNLIEPYLGSFHYNKNIFDYDFDDNVRIELAFQNLKSSVVVEKEDEVSYRVPYGLLNEEYKKLFGSNLELAQKDYAVGELGDKFYYSENSFKVVEQPGGGGGASMVSAIKDGYYNGDSIVVEVYHDVIDWCEMTEDQYCLQSWPISNEELLNLINEFGNNVSIYRMTFAKDNGHYVLLSVEKI